MRILGLDAGEKRIGVALSDPLGILASALTVIETQPDGSELARIAELAREHEAGRIVVGYPRSMDGTVGEQAQKTEAFVQALSGLTDLPIEYSDERLSTAMADDILRRSRKTSRQIKAERDAVAAALILQWYLDEHREEGSPT